MSFWQFQAAVIGVHRANSPEDESTTAPSPEQFEKALEFAASQQVH